MLPYYNSQPSRFGRCRVPLRCDALARLKRPLPPQPTILAIMNDVDQPDQIKQPDYNPNRLLDFLIDKLGLKNDAALCRVLEVAPPVISKIRHMRLPVGASMLIRMHEVSDMSIRELRDVMGDRRQKYRISTVHGKPGKDDVSE